MGAAERSVSKDSDGAPEFFISQMQDVTARKRAEAALQRTLAQKESLLSELDESTAALRNLRKEFVTVCAWTQRVHRDGEWINLTKFLADHLQLSLSHTISDEAAGQLSTE